MCTRASWPRKCTERCSQRAHGTCAITARALAVLARAGTRIGGTHVFIACTRVAAAHTCNRCIHVQPQHAHIIHAHATAAHMCNHITTHVQSHHHARAITSPMHMQRQHPHSTTAPTNVQSQHPRCPRARSPHAVQSHAHPYPHTSTLLGHPPPSLPLSPSRTHNYQTHRHIFIAAVRNMKNLSASTQHGQFMSLVCLSEEGGGGGGSEKK